MFLLFIWNSSIFFYPVHCPKLTLIQPTWSAYPYHLVFLILYPYSLVSLIWYPYSLVFSYMVMLPKHLNVKAIVLDKALLWAAMDSALFHEPLLWRHNDKTLIVSWNTRGPERKPRRGDRGKSINYLLDFNAICSICPWNNSLYIIGHNCRLGIVIGIFNKYSGLRSSDALSSWWLGLRRHPRMGKQLFTKSYDLSFQSVTVVVSAYACLYWIKGILCGYAIWTGRHPTGAKKSAADRRANADFSQNVCLTV